MLDRIEIKEKAKESLGENYWLSVGTFLVAEIVLGFVGSIPGLLLIPVVVGAAGFATNLYNKKEASFGFLFEKGFGNYGRNLGGMLYAALFTFLWTLLFIIPGIVKSFSYFLTPYILAKYENVKATEAVTISKNIMHGNKMQLFVMYLSFIGWGLLSLITCGIVGIFYVNPYIHLTKAGFAEGILDEAVKNGRLDNGGNLLGAPQ